MALNLLLQSAYHSLVCPTPAGGIAVARGRSIVNAQTVPVMNS